MRSIVGYLLENMVQQNDISGSYAKFIGISLCSLLENTQSHVVAHVLHDGTLNEDNKNRLIDLAKRYD